MVASRDINPGEVIFSEEALALGPNHSTPPCCLECLRKVQDDKSVCPNCNLLVCEEMCAYGEEHAKECEIFSKMSPKLKVDDLTKPSWIYYSITALRGLLWKKTEPLKYAILQRMMDHNEQHKKDKETWNIYKTKVVDFLIDNFEEVKQDYTAEEIHHMIGK